MTVTPFQIDTRLNILENRIAPADNIPAVWVYFGRDSVINGWKHNKNIYWREGEESDDDFKSRILSLAEHDRNPRSGQMFVAVIEGV
jgi:hypothetical protein